MTWEADAACREHDPELFAPIHGETDRGRRERVEAAITVCAECPVRLHCLSVGMEKHEHGVWGGLLLDNGKPVDHAMHRGVAPQPCGTPAAFTRHLRRGEKPCGKCRRARAQRKAETHRRASERRAPCGTESALRRHYQHHEPIDARCAEVRIGAKAG